jgi:hypothetical protein
MGSDSRNRRPARRPPAKSGKNSNSEEKQQGIWIVVAAVVVGLLILGLLRTRQQSVPVAPVTEEQVTETETPNTPPNNRPPEIQGARLVPSSPDARSRIAVTVDASDPDGDAIRYDVTWYRNGIRVKAPPLQIFPDDVAKRGDRIRAEVVATDGFHETTPYRTASVQVGKISPIATGVELTPAPLVAGQTVEAKPVGSDPDGDPIRWRFRWTKNERTVTEERGPVFPGNQLARGDRIQVTATPWDSSGPGASVQSPETVVGNRPPRIVSSPPAALQDSKLEYAVQAEDPDGDTVHFALAGKVPEGLTISQTGVLLGDLERMVPGRYDLQIVASDPEGGEDIQSLTIKVPEREGAPGVSP